MDCSIDSGSPGGGPGDLAGDAEEGVFHLISSMCCESSLKALSGRSWSPHNRLFKSGLRDSAARSVSSSFGVAARVGPSNNAASCS